MQSMSDILKEKKWQEFQARLAAKLATAPPTADEGPRCLTCGDKGLIQANVAFNDPAFGKLVPCPERCEAEQGLRRERAERLLNKSHWRHGYNAVTLSTWAQGLDDNTWGGKLGGYCVAAAFAEYPGMPFTLQDAAAWRGVQWPDGADTTARSSVVLTGPVGVGKTTLAAAVTNALKAGGVPVVFIRVLQLLKDVQAAYGSSDEDRRALHERLHLLRTVDVLVLDEFGVKNATPDRREIIEDVVRSRDRDGLPLLATTNLSLSEFTDFWQPQVADIVAQAHWVAMGGAKLRPTTQREAGAW